MVAGPFEAIRGKKEQARGVNRELGQKSKQRLLEAGAKLAGAPGRGLREGATLATATVLATPEIASWVKGKAREGGALVKDKAREKVGQLKGWFQKQVEAVRSGADTVKQYGATKKNQLFNLAHAGREAVQAKFQRVRDGLVTGVTNQVNAAKEGYKGWQAQKESKRLGMELKENEDEIRRIDELIKSLSAQLQELGPKRVSIISAINSLEMADKYKAEQPAQVV